MKTLGAVLELPAKQIQPTYLKIGPNWPNGQCCLAGSSQMAPKILIFSIAIGANYSFIHRKLEIVTISIEDIIFLGLFPGFVGPIKIIFDLKRMIVLY